MKGLLKIIRHNNNDLRIGPNFHLVVALAPQNIDGKPEPLGPEQVLVITVQRRGRAWQLSRATLEERGLRRGRHAQWRTRPGGRSFF